ncbi:MAG: hypothetical protein D6759_11680 [Chloroflexi bacterium]|nr:MAG: hypothetical protein D6759_11680 [Chloroflexota bacterium]
MDPLPRAERELASGLARLHRAGLGSLFPLLLEVGRGLGFLGAQALWLLQPLLTPFVPSRRIAAWARLLENPVALERLLAYLEELPAPPAEQPLEGIARAGESVSGPLDRQEGAR